MTIIELTELQFKNYSNLNSNRNYKQTVEYANKLELNKYKIVYIGLIDKNNNIHAASLLLKKDNYVIAPNGFLINYYNISLFEQFTIELKKYLKEHNIIFLRINPLIKYKIFDEHNNITYFEDNIINRFANLGYKHLGFSNDFNRFNVIIENNSDISTTYNKINRNIKRDIDKSNQRAISIHKGNSNNIELFYSLIQKKVNYNIDYYKNYLKYFNNNNNCFELYFAKLETINYLNNYRYLLNKEQNNNQKLLNMLQNPLVKKTNNLLNKKMLSDKLLDSYSKEVITATNAYRNYPNGIIIGTCAIIKNRKEIYFLIDGYEEKLRNIQSSHLLKWEIIKKYMNEGYRIFNLGTVPYNRNKKDNKYYGLYLSKIGFGGKVIEYPGEFDLVVNKLSYNVYTKLNKIKNRKYFK